ncbi:hypothetical protein [Streptomyces sp. NPDC057199]
MSAVDPSCSRERQQAHRAESEHYDRFFVNGVAEMHRRHAQHWDKTC